MYIKYIYIYKINNHKFYKYRKTFPFPSYERDFELKGLIA